MGKPDIKRLLEFQKLLLQFRNIDRTVYLPGLNKQLENDVEHSYFLAVTAWFLAPHFPKLDRDKLLRYALLHDFVEVFAGDTFAYGDKAHKASKQERETVALKRLQKEWPDMPEMLNEIETYEQLADEEAKFVYALDKLMPTFINVLEGGNLWKDHQISLADVNAYKMSKVPVSKDILVYYKQLYELLKASPELFNGNNKV